MSSVRLLEEPSRSEVFASDTTENSTLQEGTYYPDHKVWGIVEGEHNGLFCPVYFKTPNGFVIRADGTRPCLEIMSALAMRDIQFSTDEGSRFKIDFNGDIILLDTDKWTNPNFEFGRMITHASKLAWAIKSYLWTKVNDGKPTTVRT